jgi:hypothetical protein
MAWSPARGSGPACRLNEPIDDVLDVLAPDARLAAGYGEFRDPVFRDELVNHPGR